MDLKSQDMGQPGDHDSVSRIDLTSGFMKHIIRNQQKRDDYDKEVKEMQEQQKSQARENRNHAKKPGQAMYVPPIRANRGGPMDTGYAKDVFKLQYVGPSKETSEWLVHKGDDPHGLAERFGRQCKLSAPLIQALGSLIEEEMDKRGFQT